MYAVVEDGVWKLPEDSSHLLADNHLDDADALLTLARCLSRAESRATASLRSALTAELSLYASAWIDPDAPNNEEPLNVSDG